MTAARQPAVGVPFFATAPGEGLTRRLLLISYHFPPGQAAGALRWEKLAGFAVAYGWGVDVITLHPDALGTPDWKRLERLPPGVRIYGIGEQRPWIERVENGVWRAYRRLRPAKPSPAPEGATVAAPQAVARPDSRTREELKRQRGFRPREAYYAWLDYARQGAWARRAAEVGASIVVPGLHDAIVTCGPPHMVHEGGRLVSLRTGPPLVVDMRDPWSLVQRLAGPLASRTWLTLAEKYERKVVQHASLIVTNTDAVRKAMQEVYPQAESRLVAVMNGYDDEPVPATARGRRFVIAYAGTVYLDRDPRPLFAAAARVISEYGLSPDDFGIEFMGHAETYNGLPLQAIAESAGVGAFVRLHPPGPRESALRFLAGAALLVSLPQDSDMAIPSKVFEYMQYEAWVLALAERGSATETVLRDTTADVVAPDDIDGLTRVIALRYQQHASGQRPRPIVSDDRYSRRAQARILFERIAKITGGAGQGASRELASHADARVLLPQ